MADELESGAVVSPPSASPVLASPELSNQSPPEAPASASPVAEVVAEPAKVELATDKPTLLETFDKDVAKPAAEAKPDAKPEEKPAEVAKSEAEKPVEAKPAEAPKVEEAKPVEAKPPEPAPFEPVKYEFELPPVLKADDEKIGAFSAILNDAKLPADLGKDVGQKLLGMHADAMQSYADHLGREQHRVFNETRDGWRKNVMADEEIGGSGHQTAMGAIARARDALVPQKDRAEFENFLRITGAGDHPQFLKLLHQAARWLDEPQADTVPRNIKPVATNGRAPGNFKDVMYDNPRSNPNGRG